jgi:hypothetical protein
VNPTYPQSFGQILEPHQRSLEHICHVDAFTISIHHVPFRIARHAFIPRCAIVGTVYNLRWVEGVIIGRGETDDDVLEPQTPGADVIKVDALCGLGPREETVRVLFGDTLVQRLEALETNTHVDNGLGDFTWVGVWSA